MAVITLDYNDLVSLLGKDISMEEIIDRLPMIGSDIDSIDGDTMNVEFFPNRPDLYSVEGVARALRGFLGLEIGMASYDVGESGMVLEVDPSVEGVRPYIVSAFIQNVRIDDTLIKSLMEIQEKLHLTMGRKRKKLAIGVHDFEKLKPPFVYKAVEPSSIKFIPLGHFKEMDLNEILEKHEKGIEYAWTLEGMDKYPIILDSEGQVLSFPPIINGTVTTVTEQTENIFLDMTGTDFETLKTALNIITTMLAERGGQIKSVNVKYKDGSYILPDLAPRERTITPGYANKILGLELSGEDIARYLETMRYGASATGDPEDTVKVQVPAYRNDIIHPVDMVEDMAIAHGFENFKGILPTNLTFGKEREVESLSNIIRDLMTGYGYLESMGLTISSEKKQFTMLGRDIPENLTVILNPINEELTCARQSIYPSLLEILAVNKHRELPQSIFEVGSVVIDHKNQSKLGAMTIHPKASYTGIKSLVQSLLRDLDIEFDIEAYDDGAYIKGRVASIIISGKRVGHFGEIHPQVLNNFELGCPSAGFEIMLDDITDIS